MEKETKGETAQLPFWRRYADVEEYTVATSEYTVWETIAPAAAASAGHNGARSPTERSIQSPTSLTQPSPERAS